MSSNNPLLSLSTLPNLAPMFDRIENAHYLPAVEEGLRQARANIQAIKDSTDAPTFLNTIVAMEVASDILDNATGIFYANLYANGNDEMQEISLKISPLLSEFSNDIAQDPILFQRVKILYESIDDLNLTTEEHTILTDSYRGFVRGGALLSDDDKETLRSINNQLSILPLQFMENVTKSVESYNLNLLNSDRLKGVPEMIIQQAQEEAQSRGQEGWTLTLDLPLYMPILQYADDRELRRELWIAYSNKANHGEFSNADNIRQIVKLRHQRAQLLGYKTHADYVLEERMAKNPETVFDFLEDCINRYKPKATQELAILKEFAAKQGLEDDIQPWDLSYYSEKLKHATLDFNEEELRPYFEVDATLKGVFAHFEKLFAVRFTPNLDLPTYQPDVKAFDVQTQDGRFLANLYTDMHPRKGKKQGAWYTTYRDQGHYAGQVRRPLASIVCNLTKPTADAPALMTHDEVLTIFHEMGHAMHGILSNVTYRSKSGTSVLWDFVELPSQIQENWGYCVETLNLFAKHYQTGENIPESLIQKIRNAKYFHVGLQGLRQASMGLLDMIWHSDVKDIDKTDIKTFEEEATKNSRILPLHPQAGAASYSFSHIFAGGYSAGFYSYKWAEVLDADVFARFEKEGLYNTDLAQLYKDHILSRGGTEHPAILYKNFMGRDADSTALFEREGLIGSQ